MYAFILALHSLIRWFVLVSLLFALYRAYTGWLGNKTYSKLDNRARIIAATVAHIQLVVGLWLYFISPVVSYFLSHFKEGVQNRQIRFFGMEHITMMLIGITLITIASAKAKRKTTDQEKFKTLAIWLTIALLVILSSIPWSFSPLISRPLFRPF
ncbi:hypothetical protein [Mucilaginibacter rubeus]|uniref:Cytochrome B n=1 Tax=Mucilaginibacter rubeus TaxID=2027860 RepID=A0A5C1I878_9SPHI|nr:hypothetical protein [Mucilaginibacter rubeus]QEM13906.1 hypothetical protein DEO27_029115 [Mucilaginibacter rubeus]